VVSLKRAHILFLLGVTHRLLKFVCNEGPNTIIAEYLPITIFNIYVELFDYCQDACPKLTEGKFMSFGRRVNAFQAVPMNKVSFSNPAWAAALLFLNRYRSKLICSIYAAGVMYRKLGTK
jgi:hypothetical protein